MSAELSFEQRMKQLEQIVRGLEDGETSLEAAVESYQAGVSLVRDLREHLAGLEKKVEAIAVDGRARPFRAEERGEGEAPV